MSTVCVVPVKLQSNLDSNPPLKCNAAFSIIILYFLPSVVNRLFKKDSDSLQNNYRHLLLLSVHRLDNMNMLYLRREDTHEYEDISDYSVIQDIPVRSSCLSPKYEAIDDAMQAGDAQEQNER